MADAPDLIPIPAHCENCGTPLAWRKGVGRYVVSHDNGDDACSRASARLASGDRIVAARAYAMADEEFRRNSTEIVNYRDNRVRSDVT